jgi:hypothetical protein
MFKSGKIFFQLDSAAAAFNDYLFNVAEKLNIENGDLTLPFCPFKIFPHATYKLTEIILNTWNNNTLQVNFMT